MAEYMYVQLLSAVDLEFVYVITSTDTLKLLSYYIQKINSEGQHALVSQKHTDLKWILIR